jgi:hypothetical protein
MYSRREDDGAEPVEPWMEGLKCERMEWREPCSDMNPWPSTNYFKRKENE